LPRRLPLTPPRRVVPPSPGGWIGTPPIPGVNPGVQPIGFVQGLPTPQPLPQNQPNRRCRPCKERKKKPRTKCRQGYFRETPENIYYTTWRTKDCGKPKLKVIK
jgi:hypothetical protein